MKIVCPNQSCPHAVTAKGRPVAKSKRPKQPITEALENRRTILCSACGKFVQWKHRKTGSWTAIDKALSTQKP